MQIHQKKYQNIPLNQANITLTTMLNCFKLVTLKLYLYKCEKKQIKNLNYKIVNCNTINAYYVILYINKLVMIF